MELSIKGKWAALGLLALGVGLTLPHFITAFMVYRIKGAAQGIFDRMPSGPPAIAAAIVGLRSSKLVAIFPTGAGAALDYTREKRILADAGGPWHLVTIEGERANRQTIARELREGGARLLYFGGHGGEDRLFLTNGEDASANWLGRVVRLNNIEAVVLNACTSDGPAIACLNSGARVVVATVGNIADTEAAVLAVVFIDGLARKGTTVEDAINYAVASVNDATAEMIRAWGDTGWQW